MMDSNQMKGSKSLSSTSFHIYVLIFRRFAGIPFRLDQLSQASDGRIRPADLRAALPELMRWHFLISFRRKGGERWFAIPFNRLLEAGVSGGDSEILFRRDRRAQEALVQQIAKPRISEDFIQLQKEARRGIVWDLFRSLIWIAQHGLPITAKGSLRQRSVASLCRDIALEEKDVAGLLSGDLRSRSSLGLDLAKCPLQLCVIIDLLDRLGLIERATSEVCIVQAECIRWLEKSLEEMDSELFKLVLAEFLPDDAVLQHAALVLLSPQIADGRWHRYDELICMLRYLIKDNRTLASSEAEHKFRSWWLGWMEALSGFGWLELAVTRHGEQVFRWAELVPIEFLRSSIKQEPSKLDHNMTCSGNAQLYIQPDFELILPPEVSFVIRLKLESFCENVVTDRLSIYRMTPKSVMRGRTFGWSGQQMIQYLRSCSALIPENVEQALQEWTAADGRLADKLVDKTASDEPNLWSPLCNAWHAEQTADITVSDPSDHSWDTRMWSFAYASHNQEVRITLEEDFEVCRGDRDELQIEELFPNFDRVPDRWIKSLQSYHPSTARQIACQAIEWQTKLLLEMSGDCMEFVPVELVHLPSGQWLVRGTLYEEADGEGVQMELRPEQWQRMQLLVPSPVGELRIC